jgi:hypothetical protein
MRRGRNPSLEGQALSHCGLATRLVAQRSGSSERGGPVAEAVRHDPKEGAARGGVLGLEGRRPRLRSTGQAEV